MTGRVEILVEVETTFGGEIGDLILVTNLDPVAAIAVSLFSVGNRPVLDCARVGAPSASPPSMNR